MKKLRKLTALLLAACLCCAGCGGSKTDNVNSSSSESSEEVRATTMRLEKSEGEVQVWDEEEENVGLREKLPLYNGYSVHTQTESYGWINLDDTKLAKVDELSAAFVQKEDRHLLLTADQGSLFFNVTKPLEDDETMDIQVSDMIVGIRGTCGWVENSLPVAVYILEGTVTCEFSSEGLSAQVSAGEMAYLVKSSENRIEVKPFSRKDIPDYVLTELDDATINSIPEEIAEETTEAPVPETEESDNNLYTLPMSAEELRSLPNNRSDQPITIQAGPNDSTLVIDGFTSVFGHLILDEGVTLSVTEGAQLNIDGTLEVRSDVVNDGFIWILQDGTLQVDGTFTNNGMLVNGEVDKGMDEEPVETQNSRIIATQGIENTGYLDNAGYIEGTITVNGGNISLMAGTVDQLILNDGLYIDDGGSCGEFIQNGGKTTSAAQGYRY